MSQWRQVSKDRWQVQWAHSERVHLRMGDSSVIVSSVDQDELTEYARINVLDIAGINASNLDAVCTYSYSKGDQPGVIRLHSVPLTSKDKSYELSKKSVSYCEQVQVKWSRTKQNALI